MASALQNSASKVAIYMLRPISMAGFLVISVILAMSEAFGIGEYLSLLPRIAYWLFMSISTFFFASFSATWADVWLKKTNMNFYLQLIIRSCISGLSVSLIALLSFIILAGYGAVTNKVMLEIAVNCLVIAALISGLLSLLSNPKTTDKQAKLLSRLEPTKRGDLISLSVDGHYVELVTSTGSSKLLMRLGDAIDETNGVDGLQIHRSHWVSMAQIDQVFRQDKRFMLRLSDGRELPISRTYLAAVKLAGFI